MPTCASHQRTCAVSWTSGLRCCRLRRHSAQILYRKMVLHVAILVRCPLARTRMSRREHCSRQHAPRSRRAAVVPGYASLLSAVHSLASVACDVYRCSVSTPLCLSRTCSRECCGGRPVQRVLPGLAGDVRRPVWSRKHVRALHVCAIVPIACRWCNAAPLCRLKGLLTPDAAMPVALFGSEASVRVPRAAECRTCCHCVLVYAAVGNLACAQGLGFAAELLGMGFGNVVTVDMSAVRAHVVCVTRVVPTLSSCTL